MHTCMPVNNYTYTVIYVSTSYMSTVFIFIMAQQLSPSTKLLKVKAMTMRRENLAMGDLMGFMGYGKYLYIYFIRITHYNHQCDIYDILWYIISCIYIYICTRYGHPTIFARPYMGSLQFPIHGGNDHPLLWEVNPTFHHGTHGCIWKECLIHVNPNNLTAHAQHRWSSFFGWIKLSSSEPLVGNSSDAHSCEPLRQGTLALSPPHPFLHAKSCNQWTLDAEMDPSRCQLWISIDLYQWTIDTTKNGSWRFVNPNYVGVNRRDTGTGFWPSAQQAFRINDS